MEALDKGESNFNRDEFILGKVYFQVTRRFRFFCLQAGGDQTQVGREANPLGNPKGTSAPKENKRRGKNQPA